MRRIHLYRLSLVLLTGALLLAVNDAYIWRRVCNQGAIRYRNIQEENASLRQSLEQAEQEKADLEANVDAAITIARNQWGRGLNQAVLESDSGVSRSVTLARSNNDLLQALLEIQRCLQPGKEHNFMRFGYVEKPESR